VSISRPSIYILEFYLGKVVLMSYILGLFMLNLKQRPLLSCWYAQFLVNKPVWLLVFLEVCKNN